MRELALNLLPGQPFGALTIGERDLRLRPGELQQVPIRFSPLVPEPLAARLLVRVRDGAELREMTVALRGRGIELPLALTPSGLDFGSVALGGSRTLELRLHNRGDQVETLTLEKGTGLEVCQNLADRRRAIKLPGRGQRHLPRVVPRQLDFGRRGPGRGHVARDLFIQAGNSAGEFLPADTRGQNGAELQQLRTSTPLVRTSILPPIQLPYRRSLQTGWTSWFRKQAP
ncbi:MAG: hypothetical protein AAF627_21275 [Myxococcota bacterium]